MDNKSNFSSNHVKGDVGETMAIEYLISKGYTLVCEKYRSKIGEIDCVVKDPDGTIVFVEVKSAKSMNCGNPLFRVTSAKQKKIARVALQYLSEHKMLRIRCRFDVIGVVGEKIDHIRNAFYA
ncbi:MAG: YraN family protein [Fibrobacter sp.]|nr:YraN family protein [Fibrobacter sp.]